MKEVKSPKKPLLYYYSIVLIVILLFNWIVSPLLMQAQVEETDYGTFMRMIEEKNIGEVEVKGSEIIFTDKDETQIYKTGAMDDPTLTQRLYESGAKFSQDVAQTASPLLSYLLTGLLPLVLFFFVGQMLYKRIVSQNGGKDAMMFGMGKSKLRKLSSFRLSTAIRWLPILNSR